MLLPFVSVIALGSMLINASPLDKRQTVQGIQNALGPGFDPSVFSEVQSGTRRYYFPGIEGDSHDVFMQASNDLNTVLSVASNNYSLLHTTDRPSDISLYKYATNNYLMYYTANPTGAKSYFRVLQNTVGPDLTKNWADIGTIRLASDNTLLESVHDSYAFVHPKTNKKYLLYSINSNTIQIAELTTEKRIGKPVTVVSAGVTAEAPGAFISGNTLNIFWSENGFFTPDYNVLQVSVSLDAEPTSTDTWKGRPISTVLASNPTNRVYGPGSASTFIGPDGKAWIAYGCFYGNGGNQTAPRRVQAQPLVLNGDTMGKTIPVKPSRFVNA